MSTPKRSATSAIKKPKITHQRSIRSKVTDPGWVTSNLAKNIWLWVLAGFLVIIGFSTCSAISSPYSDSLVSVEIANKKFVFKIKTQTGGIIGGILIEAKDVFGAISKLNNRYPNCEVLEVKTK